MAEPFAAAVLQEEEKATQLPDPLIKNSNYRPAWEQTPTELRGTEQEHEAVVARDNRFGTFNWLTNTPDTFVRAGRSGGNTGYQVARQMDRAYNSGPVDPAWRNQEAKEWLKQNRSYIPIQDDWRYSTARNRDEAEMILQDKKLWMQDAKVLQDRHGITQTVAGILPSLVDLDTPLTFGAGALLSGTAKAAINASRAARIAAGGVGGGATGLALGELQEAADPNADWTTVPLMGLAGLGFGSVAGAFGKTAPRAMDQRAHTLNELGETMADGNPRATHENIHKDTFETEDNYLSAKIEEDLRQHAEQQRALDEIVAKQLASDGETGHVMSAKEQAELKAKPQAIKLDELEAQEIGSDAVQDLDQGKASIGARQLTSNGPGIAQIRSTRIQDVIQNAKTRVQQLGLSTDWLDGWRNVPQYAEGVTKQVERFHNFIAHTPIASDFARMMNSGSAVAQSVAYDLLENASGIIRNGRSGARVMEHYQKTMGALFSPFDDAFNSYATAQGAGVWRRTWDTDLRRQFNIEVNNELAGRYHDGAGHVPSHNPHVTAAADAIDRTFAKEVEIAKGRQGEIAIKGTDNLKVTSGYQPQKWSGLNIRKLYSQGRKRADIVQAVAEAYQQTYRHMDPKDAKIYADAVVSFGERTSDGGLTTNLISLLQGDGRQELMDFLVRNGNSVQEAEQMITKMTGVMEERGKPGWSKARLDVDPRFTASNGITIRDLMDFDYQSMIPARVRRSAGQAALARKGIASRADWEDIKKAIIEEQRANGKSVSGPNTSSVGDQLSDLVNSDRHLDAQFLDDLYTYFNGAPIAGGISPMYSRIKKLTNLALLNQLGLTQLAELGPTMAAVGVESFFRHAGEALTGALRKVDSPLVEELRHMSVLVPEEKLFRADLTHEFEKASTQNEWLRQFDRVLNKGQHIQGYLSGFNQIRNFQQRVAVTSAADRLARHFRDGGLISDARLKDMGLDTHDVAVLQQYVANGTVQFKDGYLHKLNMDKWAPEDAELFAYTLNQQVNTLVQKAMAGESSMFFHRDGAAQLFFHLKSFPMLALEKQALRNSRILDAQTAQTFMYGLGTAAAAYVVRQTVNGRTDNLSWEKIAKGAFGYSNMTGWIPMWTDPVAAMFGMNGLMFGGYGGRTDVISPLVGIETMNRIAKIPGAALGAADLDLSNSDINALSSFPLVGNMIGMGLMWSLMRNDNTTQKEEQRKVAREGQKRWDEFYAKQKELTPELMDVLGPQAVTAKPTDKPKDNKPWDPVAAALAASK